MYSLNYDMVVQVLLQFRYSGDARAAIKGGGWAILKVQNGLVISCLILDKNQQKLYHDAQAKHLLLKMGVLEWELAPLASSQSPNAVNLPPQAQERNIKRRSPVHPRHQAISQEEIRSWSPLQRSVYFLCDGTRSCEQIAVLLSRPPNVIEQVIHYLRVFGALEK